MKILFCGYRDWASEVLFNLELTFPHVKFAHAYCAEDLTELVRDNRYDLIAVVGWSWKIAADIVDNNIVIGMHPSKLPDYAGGSPIQHQIIDGLKESEATLFRLTAKFDDGPIVASRRYSLEGHIKQVLMSISEATFQLFVDLINDWPNFETRTQLVTNPRRRLKPEHSQLSREQLTSLSTRKLWDIIRCREDPYPNVFIQDETGKLTFKLVEFEPNAKDHSTR